MSFLGKEEIAVVGLLCLDIHPAFPPHHGQEWYCPGKMVEIGEMSYSGGGCVANTGIALHRMGQSVVLVGKIGMDYNGRLLSDVITREGSDLSANLIASETTSTSYSIILNPNNVDRAILHHPGGNETFCVDDLRPFMARYMTTTTTPSSLRIVHFGYPPFMAKISGDGGVGLASFFADVRKAGVVTSLDMAIPDPKSSTCGGSIDWKHYLSNVLPHVQFFLPSFDEIVFMLQNGKEPLTHGRMPKLDDLRHISDVSMGFGARVVVVKLGEYGLYLRTSDVSSVSVLGTNTWSWREIICPAFAVRVKGTTGAGDCAVAGFLAAVLRGSGVEECLKCCAAAGAFCVEGTDATTAVPAWDVVLRRASDESAALLPSVAVGEGWTLAGGIYTSPRDGQVVS